MIWDLHVHLSGVDGKTPEERMTQMIATADRMRTLLKDLRDTPRSAPLP